MTEVMAPVLTSPPGLVLRVEGLRVEAVANGIPLVDDVSLSLAPGEVLGLVGESGSGKTTLGLALLGYVRRGARITRGRVEVGGIDMADRRPRVRQRQRGRVIAYVPQDPASALNPARRLQAQLAEVLAVHEPDSSRRARAARLRETLAEARLPGDEGFLRRYPHQLSGGQQQRLALAMAFLSRPAVIVFDEPTTGLDVTTQRHLLDTLAGLCARHGTAGVYISHDLAVVAAVAQRVAIMYAGRLVEAGPAQVLTGRARHPYTRGLLQAVPRPTAALAGIPGHPPTPEERGQTGCAFAPRCAFVHDDCRTTQPVSVTVATDHVVRCHRIEAVTAATATTAARVPATPLTVGSNGHRGAGQVVVARDIHARYGSTSVLHGISLDLRKGESLAIVGESGSGKTTLARCLVGLHADVDGTLLLDGVPLPRSMEARDPTARRAIQYVFQNPYAALNSRHTVEAILRRPLEVFDGRRTRRDSHRRDQIVASLEHVALDPSVLRRYPRELSGGERQRVAIARALVVEPRVVICDEVTSALDVSVQATIVALLRDLQSRLGDRLSLLVVTHNLPLVRHLAQRVLVMRDGRVVEAGPTASVFAAPEDAYTARLLADTPELEGAGPR